MEKTFKISDQNYIYLRCNQLKSLLQFNKIRTGPYYSQVLGNSQRTKISILHKIFQRIEKQEIFLIFFESGIALYVKYGRRQLETFSVKLEMGKGTDSLFPSDIALLTITAQ